VKTPVVTYSDGPEARVAREGNTTSTSAQAETPATIINKEIRQPIGIRIEGQVLEHFHFYSAQASLLYTPKVKTHQRGTVDRPQKCRCYTTAERL